MTKSHLERRIGILITNQKVKINIALDKIRNFLLSPETQSSPLLEQFQIALTEKENHEKSHKEKQTLTFQFDKNLEMIGIQFLTFPFSEKKINGEEPVFVIDWSHLEQIQEGGELPVTLSYSKYSNLVGKNKIFLSSLKKIIEKKNVNVVITFESLNVLFGADTNNYTKPLEELVKLKKEFPDNIQIIFSENDKKLIEKFIQIQIHYSSNKQKDEFKRANNFLEVFDLK